jgi:hypothetical protein
MEKNNIEYKHNPLSQFEIENSDSNTNKIETTSTEEEESNENNINKIIILNKEINKKIEKINEKFLFKFKGRSLFIFGDKYGNPLFIIGPHWPMYFCYCGIVSLFMGILFFSQIWNKMSKIVRILGEIIYLFYFVSYTLTFLLNPGYPRNTIGRRTGKPRKNYYFCEICEFWINKDSLTSHCFDCNICIEGYDHHCPWTSKCIGSYNLFSSYVFLITLIINFIFFILLVSTFAQNY